MNIDLSKLPVPSAIETLDYATILSEMKAEFLGLWPSYSSEEHDPITKVLEVAALRELKIRQSHNEKASQIMLAYAAGPNLDALSALPWLQVTRQIITPADNTTTPPTPAVYEGDDRFRQRLLLAYNQLSTAGSIDSYKYHTLTTNSTIKDVKVDSPVSGGVRVTVLSSIGDGTVLTAVTDQVLAALTADSVRPLTDTPTVQSAEIINYSIDATLTLYPGESYQVIIDAINTSINDFVSNNHKLGYDINVSGVYAALRLNGVQNVVLNGFSEIICTDQQAPYCTAITLSDGGIGV